MPQVVLYLYFPPLTIISFRETDAFPFSIGMPEMLKPTSLIMGAGLGLDVACLTDGRFSGG